MAQTGFIVGSNMPGYLPEGEPEFYPDAESAQFGYVDIVQDALDSESDGLELIDHVNILHTARYLTPEQIEALGYAEEVSVMIGKYVYWITRSVSAEDIISAKPRVDA